LLPNEKVLIVDDFLASGATIQALARLTQAAGSEVCGVGTLIEKTFEGGRESLAYLNVPVHALVQITSLDDGKIEFSN
jgi:xanthine phosphoribosyltransferase